MAVIPCHCHQPAEPSRRNAGPRPIAAERIGHTHEEVGRCGTGLPLQTHDLGKGLGEPSAVRNPGKQSGPVRTLKTKGAAYHAVQPADHPHRLQGMNAIHVVRQVHLRAGGAIAGRDWQLPDRQPVAGPTGCKRTGAVAPESGRRYPAHAVAGHGHFPLARKDLECFPQPLDGRLDAPGARRGAPAKLDTR